MSRIIRTLFSSFSCLSIGYQPLVPHIYHLVYRTYLLRFHRRIYRIHGMLKSRCVLSFGSALKLETKCSRVHGSRTIDFRGKLVFPYFPDEDFGYRYICVEIYMKMEKRSAESCRKGTNTLFTPLASTSTVPISFTALLLINPTLSRESM